MKYVLAAVAAVAAAAALFFRPPHSDSAAGIPWAPSTAAAEESQGHRGRTAQAHTATSARILVYVAGEVNKPGVYALASGARALEALARAGGPKSDADLVAVNLAAHLADGAEIAVPKIGEPGRPSRRGAAVPRLRAAHPARGHGGHRRREVPEAQPPQSVDLNSADENELETLPGVGPALAARIVAYRETNGPFASVDELADVAGITPRLQDELADLVVIR